MNTRSSFVLMLHDAKRAGLHHDLRFKKPNSNKWISFAFRKELPKKTSDKKIMLVRTNDHSESDAKFTGTIKSGYGEGTIKKIDGGSCTIKVWKPSKIIVVEFKGHILKGDYCFLPIFKDAKNEYLLLKMKDKK